MSAVDYREYIASDAWKHVRELALEHYGESCGVCGETEGVAVHHRTYARLGFEKLSDLIPLCRRCHAKHHDELPDQENDALRASLNSPLAGHIRRLLVENGSPMAEADIARRWERPIDLSLDSEQRYMAAEANRDARRQVGQMVRLLAQHGLIRRHARPKEQYQYSPGRADGG